MGTHEIPSWWEAANLSDVVSKLVDGSHNPPAKQGAGLPMLSAVNINDNKIICSDYRLITENAFLLEDKRTRISPGDVLLTIVGAIGRAAVVTEAIPKFTLQRSVAVITPQLISSKFLMYQFGSPRVARYFTNNARGTAQKGVYLKTLGNTEIWLPPINEQHRIVAKIEELFSELYKGIENLKTAQAQLKVYRQALLKHAFEGKLTAQWRAANPDKLEPAAALLARIQTEREQRYQQQLQQWQAAGGSLVQRAGKPKAPKSLPPLTAEELTELPELPEGWGWVKAEEACSSVRDGTHDTPKYVTQGIPLVTSKNLRDGRIDFSDTQFISEEDHELISIRSAVDRGDVLYAMIGTIGNPVVVSGTEVFSIKNVALFKRNPQFLDSKFLSYWLGCAVCDRVLILLELLKGTTQKFIPLGNLRVLPVPICSVLEQQQIVQELESKLSEADQLDLTLTTSLQQAEALRQSILKRAFSGQLVAQDSNDEPASVLLARIKSEKAEAMAKPRKPKQVVADPVPVQSNVIPFPVKIPNISATDLHAGILARAYQHHEHAPKYLAYFGHVKAEKIAHMVEAHLGIDLEREAFKDAAGPNDYPHLMKVESRARKANWFDVRKRKDGDGYEFSKKPGFDALLLKVMHALGERAGEVDALISLLLPLKSRQAEIVATLYAAWNNLLLQGRSPSDEEIVYEARECWHSSKLEIEREKFFKGVEWMRLKGLVPAGKGRYVGAKKISGGRRKKT